MPAAKPAVQTWDLKSKKFVIAVLVIGGAYLMLGLGRITPEAALGVIWKAATAYFTLNVVQKFANGRG